MDLLGNSKARRAILDYYQASGEPQAVQEAIKVSERQAKNAFTLEKMKRDKPGYVPTPRGGLSYEKVGGMLVGEFKLNPTKRPLCAWLQLYLTPKRYHLKQNRSITSHC